MSSGQSQNQSESKNVPEAASLPVTGRAGTSSLRSSDSALFRPVVDDSCRRSLLLPASFTLEALRKEVLESGKGTRSGCGGGENGSGGGSGGGDGSGGGSGSMATAEKPRAMSPMSTLLIRTDY